MPSTVSNIVCLLDDEPSVLKALGRLLASEGFATEKFTEPAAFLAYVQNHAIPLAVVDVRMPGMSGLEVLKSLREKSPSSRVIIITAEDDPAHRAAATAGGASAFFRKPLDDDDALLRAVHAALECVNSASAYDQGPIAGPGSL